MSGPWQLWRPVRAGNLVSAGDLLFSPTWDCASSPSLREPCCAGTPALFARTGLTRVVDTVFPTRPGQDLPAQYRPQDGTGLRHSGHLLNVKVAGVI